jgi:archaellum component FlaF (FlaF/FlaG flagellin family)
MKLEVGSLLTKKVNGLLLALAAGLVTTTAAVLLASPRTPDRALAIVPTPTPNSCQLAHDVTDCLNRAICPAISDCLQCCQRFGGGGACQDACEHPITTPPAVGATTRISVDSAGNQANGASSGATMTADGRFVFFWSTADLAPGGTGFGDFFVRDRETGETRWVSDGRPGAISGDGRYVAYESGNGMVDIFLTDRQTGQTERVSEDGAGNPANGVSVGPVISADGRYVAFTSFASNLVAGDTNNQGDAFVYDGQIGETTRVSVDAAGTEGNDDSWASDISADGRYVVLSSDASNLVPGDTNGECDVIAHDRVTGENTLVSVDSAGNQGDLYSNRGVISANNRYIAFVSAASNLVTGDTGNWDIFVHDLDTRETVRVSVSSAGHQGNGQSSRPDISADGRYVVFDSIASNLVPGDTALCGSTPAQNCRDIFVHDLQSGETTRLSVDGAGNQGYGDSEESVISASGRYVAFTSFASNLVQGDTNGMEDVFIRDLQAEPGPVGGMAAPDNAASAGGGSNGWACVVAGVAAAVLTAGVTFAGRRYSVRRR